MTVTATPAGPVAGAGAAAGPVTLLGIRHHGPGSARAVAAALAELKPDAILIEGPPEADALIPMAVHPSMRPPVALLVYADADPSRAGFWPFAEFSPEWIAMRFGVGADIPVRFIDLPSGHRFADLPQDEDAEDREQGTASEDDQEEQRHSEERHALDSMRRTDPIAALATAAGYDDPERWWEDVVEQRANGTFSALDSFAAIAEAMAAVRDQTRPEDEQREAYMRQCIREEIKAGRQRIAVICGAFHVPALAEIGPAAPDAKILKELPKKAKTTATWVPWTHGRLSFRSGYGAGIESPGWYHHLFTAPDLVVERWLARVAELFRAEDLMVSSAHLIEATRLAQTLATLRGRTLAGLTEVTEAVQSVLCDGYDTQMALVRDKLVIGEDLGEVPPDVPVVPLAADLAKEHKRLRFGPRPGQTEVKLDLREPNPGDKSRLLHRLNILGIHWGTLGRSQGSGTFWETWSLDWQPEFAVKLVEAAIWGTTVATAASAKSADRAANAEQLAGITDVVEACLLADLPDALDPIMTLLADRAALDTDVAHLADALPALARTLRYGDVRGTDTSSLRKVADTLVVRIALGFPPACSGLDEDGAQKMRVRMDKTHQAVGLLDDAAAIQEWHRALRLVADREGMTGLLAGRALRLLYDADKIDGDELNRRMGLALTPGVPPAEAAAWLDGVLSGGAMLLIHDPVLLGLLDRWIAGIPADTFTDVLPLLRRTFSNFEGPERRKIGELARTVGAAPVAGVAAGAEPPGFDRARADRALPVVRMLLGLGTKGETDA
ncbi:DUF5682 family protein [Catenulispora pinisilvae]|uniref:DUF5682 family protein n=1 Tax=Catenulispora pinisilvae TaxID=2705253 RepID=UPI0018914387|nr:DUF5682 family protein [Catenulispora pinisilvae]